MGLMFLKLRIANFEHFEIEEELDFVLDSGARYTVVAAPVLERLGIEPLVEQEFGLSNGDKIRRKKGAALFRYCDRVGSADVIFGEEGDVQLLGWLALESLGLALDPLKRELRSLPKILARQGG